ncbi:ribonucleoside-diphosphate reductase, adenosylcobalamin-dependent [archaeon]|nr:ribonucleoside-diphosphate reductase, adenosylcobalamin-dependent [archaeon]
MVEYKDAIAASTAYFNGDDLAANVFITKYALTDKDGNIYESTPDDMHHRMAKEFARIEDKYPNPISEEEIYELFKNFKYIVPQGSPMSGIGNPYQVQSISNCFVIESPFDSYGGILKTDQELVQIAKRRGGVGFDISTIRPNGQTTANCARTTDGIEVFMDRFSNSCREVAQNGRRGALMLTMSVHHPQIQDFIKIKRNLTRVTGANISIRLSNEFLYAVEKGKKFQLRFPVDSSDPQVTKMIDANKLWDEIIESAHACAEPGLLFWDNAKNLTPSDVYEEEGFGSQSTNPCGEIVLSPHDSCRLMVVNLLSFVRDPFTSHAEFDYGKLGEIVHKAQRLMDDMVDLEVEQVQKILAKIDHDPEPDEVKQIEKDLWSNIETMAMLGRRTGLGVTAVGDALAAIGIRYGSDESIEIVEKFYKTLVLNAYRSSCIMAKERGAFEVHNHDKERGHEFLERIWEAAPDVYEMSKKYGRRNIALTTTAPAGSVSTLTQTTSGIEPAYLLKYTRRKKLTENDVDGRVDFMDDMGDRWQEYDVYHHGFQQWLEQSGIGEEKSGSYEKLEEMSPYMNATSNDINWIAKVKMQAAAQRWICHAISNTTNVPADTDVDTIKKIYLEGWKSGCKGVTVYRDGCRTGVLVSKKDDIKFKMHDAPERPPELPCFVHHVKIKGEAWTILVGLMDNRPYEVLGGLQKYIEIPKKYNEGIIVKHPRKSRNSIYDMRIGKNGDEFLIKDIVSVFDNPNYAGYTRTISLALRHGAPIHYVVEQLQKDIDADLFSFSKVIARVLKSYISNGTKPGKTMCPNCSAEDTLRYQEGCVSCTACGHSKCS